VGQLKPPYWANLECQNHQYDWPGNKRELETAIRRAVALSSGPVLEVADLPPELQSFRACSEDAELTADMSETGRATISRQWRSLHP
jgi:transcriptional regulator of acetoin/glycerol metabolism